MLSLKNIKEPQNSHCSANYDSITTGNFESANSAGTAVTATTTLTTLTTTTNGQSASLSENYFSNSNSTSTREPLDILKKRESPTSPIIQKVIIPFIGIFSIKNVHCENLNPKLR